MIKAPQCVIAHLWEHISLAYQAATLRYESVCERAGASCEDAGATREDAGEPAGGGAQSLVSTHSDFGSHR
jgi:hypothetical protein